MDKLQALALFAVLSILALLFAGGCFTGGVNETWGDLQDILIGGFPKIDDNEALLSKAEIDNNNEEKKNSSGPDFIAPVNYYRMMAMMVIVNPPDVSYILWIQSSFKVLIVLAAQVAVPIVNLHMAMEKVKSVEIAGFQDFRASHFIALLTVCVWMNKVLITKVDDALSANCYILDRWYHEPEMAKPKYDKDLRGQQMQRGICGRMVVKHFWCALSFGIKILMSIVVNLNALLAVSEFYGNYSDVQQVFVNIGTIYLVLDLDSTAVIADGHSRQRYRTYVNRLLEVPPAGPKEDHQPLLSLGARTASAIADKPPSFYYTYAFGWYKYLMRVASLVLPLILFVMQVNLKPEALE